MSENFDAAGLPVDPVTGAGAPGASTVGLGAGALPEHPTPATGTALVARASAEAAVGTVDGEVVESRTMLPTRRDARVSRPARHPQWLVNQLPVGMLQSDFFVRFVSLFQELSGGLLDGADQVVNLPDATVTPVPMIGHLAGWIGVDTVDASLPEQLQRLILRSSAAALAHRGTIRGLQGYLEMLSGAAAEVTDGGGVWQEGDAPGDVAWVQMRVEGTGHLSEDEFVGLVRDEIPAHVRAELWVGDKRALSTSEEDR